MADTTLNEKILEILHDKIEWGMEGVDGRDKAANEIEKILLQSQVDLLNELTVKNLIANPVSYAIPKKSISDKISELTNHLKELNK